MVAFETGQTGAAGVELAAADETDFEVEQQKNAAGENIAKVKLVEQVASQDDSGTSEPVVH